MSAELACKARRQQIVSFPHLIHAPGKADQNATHRSLLESVYPLVLQLLPNEATCVEACACVEDILLDGAFATDTRVSALLDFCASSEVGQIFERAREGGPRVLECISLPVLTSKYRSRCRRSHPGTVQTLSSTIRALLHNHYRTAIISAVNCFATETSSSHMFSWLSWYR